MRAVAFVAVLAILAWNADAFARPIPPHMTAVVIAAGFGFAAGFAFAFQLGRARQRFADTRKFYGSRAR